MSDKYIHACYHCPKVFRSTAGQDTNRPCPSCGNTATYLCPENQWQKLENDAKIALFNDCAPNQDAKLTTTDRLDAHASQGNAAPHSDTIPLILGLFGAAIFALAGYQMLDITSVATSRGDSGSIAEAFYHVMGWFSFGMALLSATLGYMGWKK